MAGEETGAGEIGDQALPAAVVAGILGIDQRHLRRLHADGYVPQEEYGKYRLAAAVQGYVRFLKSRQPREQSERAKLERAQRAKLEMQLARQRGELLPAAMVDETLQTISQAFVGQIEGQASRLANELAGISEPALVRAKLQDDARRIRGFVAETIERRAEALRAMREAAGDLAPAAEEDAGAVGGREPGVPAGEPGAGAVPEQ